MHFNLLKEKPHKDRVEYWIDLVEDTDEICSDFVGIRAGYDQDGAAYAEICVGYDGTVLAVDANGLYRKA